MLLLGAWPAASQVTEVVKGRCTNCFPYSFKLGTIHFTTQREGWASAYWWPVQGGGLSTLLHTTDGGRHWRRLPFVLQTGAESGPSYSFVDRDHGWVQWTRRDDGDSFVSNTTNAGRSWSRRRSPSFVAMQFFDRLHGYAAGRDFLQTSDGGRTWKRVATPLATTDVMSFSDPHDGVLIGGDTMPWDSPLRILVTQDGGAHWTPAKFPERPYGRAAFLVRTGARTVFTAIRNSDEGTELLWTRDGGLTWSRHPDETVQGAKNYVNEIIIAPNGRGYLFHDDKIAITTDGGATWKQAPFRYTVAHCQLFAQQVWCSSGMNVLKLDLP